MISLFTFTITGLVLGLNGLIPGPLFTLIVAETLRHNIREGIKVAISPLFTDLPIVLFSILVLSRLAEQRIIMGIISLAGSAFLIYLACESISYSGAERVAGAAKPRSLKKGIITNFLNPAPYMFWFSVGAPTFVRALDKGISSAIFFISAFYMTLIGSMVMIAEISGRSRHFLKSRYYVRLIRFLGIMLLIFAVIFIRNGAKYMGWL